MKSCALHTQKLKHDADLPLRRVLPPRGTPDVSDRVLSELRRRTGFLTHLRSEKGYDEPEILPYSNRQLSLMVDDAGQVSVLERLMLACGRAPGPGDPPGIIRLAAQCGAIQ